MVSLDLAAGPVSDGTLYSTLIDSDAGPAAVGALQLAPNGKIYGTKVGQNTLFEIGDPNNSSPGSVLFNLTATTTGGGPLTLHKNADLGLPTFTRIAPDCACPMLGDEIDRRIAERRMANSLHRAAASRRSRAALRSTCPRFGRRPSSAGATAAATASRATTPRS